MLKFASAPILDVSTSRGSMTREAHRAQFDYTPREGMIYVRSRAISSRCNLNYDEFPAGEIKQAYRTFVGKPVFVNHHNADRRRARGFVIDAALHEDRLADGHPDTWVEVLMEVDGQRFPKLAHAVLAGHIDRTSMGVDCGSTECTACGNVATDPAGYCQHVPRMKGNRIYRRTASGRKRGELIREICRKLSFFENSLLVEDPADPTAVILGVDGGNARTASLRRQPLPRLGARAQGVMDPALFFGMQRTAVNPVGKDPDKSKGHGQGPQPTDTCAQCGGRIYYNMASKHWIHDDDAGAGIPHDAQPTGSHK